MNPPFDPAAAPDPRAVGRALDIVRGQVETALWLSAGMVFAFVAVGCMALAWRRAALAFGFLYCLTLCFVRNGHAQLIGPVGCAVSATGLLFSRALSRPGR
jgi:hypothetical protein